MSNKFYVIYIDYTGYYCGNAGDGSPITEVSQYHSRVMQFPEASKMRELTDAEVLDDIDKKMRDILFYYYKTEKPWPAISSRDMAGVTCRRVSREPFLEPCLVCKGEMYFNVEGRKVYICCSKCNYSFFCKDSNDFTHEAGRKFWSALCWNNMAKKQMLKMQKKGRK